MDDPYQVLSVRSTASDEAIRAAFRRRAKELHPDLQPGDRAAEQRFRDVLRAYETLTDAPSRRAYDASLALRRKRLRTQATTAFTVFTLTVSVGLMFWRELSGAILPTAEAPAKGSGDSVVVAEFDGVEQLPTLARTPAQSSAPDVVVTASIPPPTLAAAPKPPPEAQSEPEDKGRVPTLNVAQEPESASSGAALLLLPGEYPEDPRTGGRPPEEVHASPKSLPAPTQNAAQNWASYTDVRLGLALEHPADVFVSDQTLPGNTLRSRDGRARLTITGASDTGDVTLAQVRRLLLEIPYKNAELDYAPQRRTWFVLSGKLGTDIFYERVTFTCDGRAFHGWKLVYPASERAFYDPIVEEVHRRYRHGKSIGGPCG